MQYCMCLFVLACIVMKVKLVVVVESRKRSDEYANMDCCQFAWFIVEGLHLSAIHGNTTVS